MRYSSTVGRASVAVMVAISVGACAAAPTSPSSRATVPAASASVSATSSTDVAVQFDLPSKSSVVDSPPQPTIPAPSSASIPAGARIDGRIQVGQPVAPRWFAADGQSLWVHEPVSLVRVDLATSAVTGEVPLNSMEYGYDTTGAGSVWQTDYENDRLLRIDPVTGKTDASIPVGSQPLGVAVTAGSVWVADEHDEAVTRVDPRTNRVVATIKIGEPGPAGPQILTAGPGGGVWVSVPNLGEVVRIDPATNKVGLVVPWGGYVASDGVEVWIAVDAGIDGKAQAIRIDPDSGKVITAVDLDQDPGVCGMAVGLGSVWVTTGGLTRIDPAAGRIVGRLDLGGDCGNVTVAGGAVWVAAEGQPYVVRISPK
jgi:virginiamycin B lyase